jgi:hypothetical protein
LKRNSILLLVICAFILSACSNTINSEKVDSIEQESANPSLLPSSTSPRKTPTAQPTPSPTPSTKQCHTEICWESLNYPTMHPFNNDALNALITSNGGCDLPCFFGIIPGETQWAEVLKIVEPYARNTTALYDSFDGTAANQTKSVEMETERAENDVYINIVSGFGINTDGIIQTIKTIFNLMGNESAMPYDDRLSSFGISEVLKNNGVPDEVYFNGHPRNGNGSYDIAIEYQHLHMVVLTSGMAISIGEDRYSVCPNIGDGQITNTTVLLTDSSYEGTLADVLGYPYNDGPTLLSESGISPFDFYELMTSEGILNCFEIED